jgi:aspartate/methionine/tyrosine aminotransferase
LREAIAERYLRRYGVTISPEQVIVTSGTSPALLLILLALLNPGERVILTNPRYACYPNFIRAAGGDWLDVPISEDNDFQLPLDAIEALLPQAKALLINSPSNPTGTVLAANQLQALAGMIDSAQGPYIISDEIYHGLSYGQPDHSILEFTDRAFVIDGFSKRYAMTGWRLGYAIVPPEFVRPIQKLQQNLFICAESVGQWAAITALNECDSHVQGMVAEYNKRRLRLLAGLEGIGLSVRAVPQGAFYVFLNVSHISRDSYGLAFDILEKAGVAVTPGVDFGTGGEGYLRLSYATSLDYIDEAMKRLKNYLRLG